MEKKKITVDIAGSRITLVTDEPEDFVSAVTSVIDERVRELTQSSFRVTPLDAALLLAVDYLSDKLKAEQRIRTLESQLSVCEVNLRSAKEQLDGLLAERGGESGEAGAAVPSPDESNAPPRTLGDLIDAGSGKDSVIRAMDKYLDAKKSGAGDGGMSREEKIRCIESMLRGMENDKK